MSDEEEIQSIVKRASEDGRVTVQDADFLIARVKQLQNKLDDANSGLLMWRGVLVQIAKCLGHQIGENGLEDYSFLIRLPDVIVSIRAKLEKESADCRRLEDAIRLHRSQKADDRCIEDDDRLYEALGDGIKCDRRVGDRKAMLENCKRFIMQRCELGDAAHWPTYAQLEARIAELEAANAQIK